MHTLINSKNILWLIAALIGAMSSYDPLALSQVVHFCQDVQPKSNVFFSDYFIEAENYAVFSNNKKKSDQKENILCYVKMFQQRDHLMLFMKTTV